MAAAKLLQITRRLLPEPEHEPTSPINEVLLGLGGCEWYQIYDVAEAIYAALPDIPGFRLDRREYEKHLNKVFRERGVGWQMQSGKIVVRGSETFEAVTREASETLVEHGRSTASRQLHEALQDLSRRPEPDVSGAIQHAIAGLECVARDVSGQSSATLGAVISQHAAALGIRPPLDTALEKLWGYASQEGRHLREGRDPGFEEAELVVTVAAAVSVYLSKKFRT